MTYERAESFQPRMITRELLVDMFRGNPDITVGQTDFEIRVGYDEKINGEIKKLRGFFMPRSRTWRVPLNEVVGVIRLVRRIVLINTERDFSDATKG